MIKNHDGSLVQFWLHAELIILLMCGSVTWYLLVVQNGSFDKRSLNTVTSVKLVLLDWFCNLKMVKRICSFLLNVIQYYVSRLLSLVPPTLIPPDPTFLLLRPLYGHGLMSNRWLIVCIVASEYIPTLERRRCCFYKTTCALLKPKNNSKMLFQTAVCRSTSLPQPSRKVSLSTINRTFNQVACVDHMFLREHCVLHIMDTKTRFSADVICNDTSLSNAIYVLQTGWLTPFWTPASIRADDFINHTESIDFVKSIGSQFEPFRHIVITKICWSLNMAFYAQYLYGSRRILILLTNTFSLLWFSMFPTNDMDPTLCRLMKWLTVLQTTYWLPRATSCWHT